MNEALTPGICFGNYDASCEECSDCFSAAKCKVKTAERNQERGASPEDEMVEAQQEEEVVEVPLEDEAAETSQEEVGPKKHKKKAIRKSKKIEEPETVPDNETEDDEVEEIEVDDDESDVDYNDYFIENLSEKVVFVDNKVGKSGTFYAFETDTSDIKIIIANSGVLKVKVDDEKAFEVDAFSSTEDADKLIETIVGMASFTTNEAE